MFASVKLKLYLIIAVLLAGIGYTAYWYYTSTQDTIAELNKAVTIATQAAQDNKAAYEAQVKSAALQQIAAADLAIKNQLAEREVDNLRELLAEHRLEYLAAAKPGLLETKSNTATKKVFNELKDLSKPHEKTTNTNTNN